MVCCVNVDVPAAGYLLFWFISLVQRVFEPSMKVMLVIVLFTQEDEVERLTTLLDEEGDGRVSYRSLLVMLVKHLGDWTIRLPEVRLQHLGC